MKPNSRQGFVLSVVLHLGMAATVALVTLYQPPVKPAVTVFELVSAPPPPAEEGPAQEDEIQFSVPKTRPPPRRVPPPPERRPEPPVPVPQKTPAPKKQPPPPPEKISYEEFIRKQGQPKVTAPKKTAPRPLPPRIDTRFSPTLRESVINLESLNALSDLEQSALDSYISRLKAALKRVWDKPVGLAHSMAAVVEFDLAASGRISGVRITSPSGNSQFDQSVLESFTTLGTAGTTPDGKPMRLRLTFRMTDD